MTTNYCWILPCSVNQDLAVIALTNCIRLKDQLGLYSINCHIYAMTESCFASLETLTDSLTVVSAMTGNLPSEFD